MRLLGINDEIVDTTNHDNLGKRVFEFSLQKEDYFANLYLQWDKIEGDIYRLNVGGRSFSVGSGMYIFIGCDYGSGDWVTIDEIIGRDIKLFTVSPCLDKWGFDKQTLQDVYVGSYFFPNTKNPVPIVSACGTRFVMVANSDHYRTIKDQDFYALFIV
jgi:hypothetical protein